LGLNEDQVAAGLKALAPALAAGFQKEASSEQGLGGLLGALGGGQHARYLDDLSSLSQPETVKDGNGILGHIFGSKEVSRQVATRAAAQSGISADLLKKLLPIAAALMMGALSKRRASVPAGGTMGANASAGSDLFGMLTPMLDRNRDGSMLDDIIGMAGGFLGKRT
jgi:hypothetical protein